MSISYPLLRDQHLQDTPAMPATEKDRLLYSFNNTARPYVTTHTLVSLFKESVQHFPEHVAVVHRDQQLTYQQLDQRSNQLANYLQSAGIGRTSLVPIWLNRSIDLIVAIVGILKTGAAYIPVDTAYPGKRVKAMLEDAQATIVITDADHLPLLPSGVKGIQLNDSVIEAQSTISNEVDITPGQLAYVIYTSGSTGTPKGVQISHQAIQHLITWHNQRFGVTPESRLSFVAGVAFDIAVWEIWSALAGGAALYIADHEDRTHAAQLIDYYQRNQITHGFSPTVLIPEVVNASRQTRLSLSFLFTGGEKLKPVNTKDLPYTLVDYYGPTECTVFATYRIVNSPDGEYVPSIGIPLPNTQAYIMDPHMELAPLGTPGELCISGICLAEGYLNSPAITAEKFIAHPYQAGKRLYRTGDLAKWKPDGTIEFIGRIDKQVKIRGYRIELGDIEHALVKGPGISAAVVIAKENAQHNKFLVAFVVPGTNSDRSSSKSSLASIRQQLKLELPGYMVPAHIVFLETIPVNANGKTDLQQLHNYPLQSTYTGEILVEASTPMEKMLHGIWSNILDLPRIDVTDNFFDIGGDSLQVAAVVSGITTALNVKAYVRDIYQHPTIQSLATIITNRLQAPASTPEEDMEPIIELQKDVYLAPGTVISNHFDPRSMTDQQNILLTGATGFVGIHLLHDLLTGTKANIYCLVRSNNEYDALLKINALFTIYHIPVKGEDKKRIIPVTGDLALPDLGLSQQHFDELSASLDVIYHSGSSVNFIEPYSFNKYSNVEGVRSIIKLASHKKTKCLVLLSTISVYSWGHVFTNKTVMTEADSIKQNIVAVSKDIGYVRSKYVMEEIADLAASQGLPVVTFRLGYAMCHSTSGVCAAYQWWSNLVKTCIEYKSYPALTELREGLITVDFMTRAIAHISKNPKAIGLKFNLIASPSNNLTLEQFFDLLQEYYSFNMKKVPYKEWRKNWEHDKTNYLYPLTSLFRDNMHNGLSTVELYQHTYVWDNKNVLQFLEGSDVKEPVFNKEVLDAYLKHLKIEC